MSFTLKSIELKNIRAHEYLLFEPELNGITAISGPNGAGKSTIIDSFAWSLYGTRPSGIKNRNLIREGVDPKKAPVSVKSIILVGGIEYAIERKIITSTGTTECNVWGKKEDTDKFTQVAGPAVTHVEKFIKNLLGMNEKGFLTSILIQQKQVDQIISSTPKERGIVIEELTGIASISQAIQKENESTRELEKAASILQVGNVDAAQEKVDKQISICSNLQQKENEAIEKFNLLKEEYNQLKKELSIEEVKVSKRIKLTQDIDSYKRQIEFLKKQSEEDVKYIMEFKEKYGNTIAVDVKESKANVDKKRNELSIVSQNLSNCKQKLESAIADMQKCEILKEDFESIESAERKLLELEKALEELTLNLETLKNDKAIYTSEIKHSKESHEHLNGENKNCPVCRSSIEDPESLKKEIEKEIADYELKKKQVVKEINSHEKEIASTKEIISKVKISIEAIKEEKRLLNLKSETEKQIKELNKKESLLKVDVETLEKEYDKALKVQSDKNYLKAAKERSLTVNENIDKNESLMKDSLNKMKELDALSDRSYSALIKRVEDSKERLSKITITGKEIRGRRLLELERLEDYKNSLEQVKESMRKYKEIADKIKVSTSSSVTLSTFKADRIEDAIPTLEFYASDFLSKFTGGEFTKMTVDKKFNTFVTLSNGIVRPVAQLSGGELSSAAIALRLGIAMLLNSSEANLLILDEVLVSMDEDRSRQIMETIGSMTNAQVIFIAHNTDINSVADKTVTVEK